MLRNLVVILSLGLCLGAPTTYDQRQDGDLNVKVDLDNFVILVARPVSALDVFGSMAELFADARGVSTLPTDKEQEDAEGKFTVQEEEKLKDLEDVSLDNQAASKPEEKPRQEEAMVLLVQEGGEKAARSLEHIVRSLRNLKTKEEKKGVGKYKFVESVDEPQSLKLIGDAVENCGPGRSRDRLGICQGDGLAQE